MISQTPDQEIKGEFRMRCRRLLSRNDKTIYTVSGGGQKVFISTDNGYVYSMISPEISTEATLLYKVDIGVDGSPVEFWDLKIVRDVALPLLRKHMVLDDLSDV